MYWKLEALTAKRTETIQVIEGNLEDVKTQADVYGLEILDISPDYRAFLNSIFQSRKLSASVLSVFFNDFADMQRCGLSVHEAVNTLNETTSKVALKEALRKISNFINDGRSLEEAFENTKAFPKIVSDTLGAAEKTGNIPELSDLLAQFYRFKCENQQKITKSLLYPGVVFCMLSGLSIFISVTLVPQLRSFLPACANQNLSAIILIGYAHFLKEYWWVVIASLAAGGWGIKYFWDNNREGLMEAIFSIPLCGCLMKEIELSHIFLNLYVYQKSGVNIIQTITNIHRSHKTYITEKLMAIRERIFKGASIGDAFKQDSFFPPFVWQNLSKGQISGFLPQYLERISRYYDVKTKESIGMIIATIEPVLLVLAACFLLMIVSAFILPVYTSMNQMGVGTLR